MGFCFVLLEIRLLEASMVNCKFFEIKYQNAHKNTLKF